MFDTTNYSSFENSNNTSFENNSQKHQSNFGSNNFFYNSYPNDFKYLNNLSSSSLDSIFHGDNSFNFNDSISSPYDNSIYNEEYSNLISEESIFNLIENEEKKIIKKENKIINDSLGKKRHIFNLSDYEEKKLIKEENKNIDDSLGKKRLRKHDKYAKDNIKRKIQVNYLKFLRNLLNEINKELLHDHKNLKNIEFYPLDYNFTKEVRKKNFESLKKTTLGDIFKYNVSPKFKNYKNLNIQIYNKITGENEIIKNILDKTYLEFFNVYYLNIKTINLSKYGLDKNIIFSSDIGSYKDLLKKKNNDSISLTDDINYHKKIEKCIKSDFISSDKPIFIVE